MEVKMSRSTRRERIAKLFGWAQSPPHEEGIALRGFIGMAENQYRVSVIASRCVPPPAFFSSRNLRVGLDAVLGARTGA